jgi:4-carboxymuconolactone decarboxylase
MARLPYADLSALPPEAQAEVAPFAHLNLTRMLAHAGPAFLPWQQVIRALLTSPDLPATLREVAILRVAHRLDSPYEWDAHAIMARTAGLTDDQIDALRMDAPAAAGVLEDLALTVAAVVDDLTDGGHAEPELVDELQAELGASGTVQLLLAIGAWTTAAYVLNATGVDRETEARGVEI